jgi:hypothetical protein
MLEKKLQSLPSGSIIRSIYGHHGRHVAWVILPAPKLAKRQKGQNGE